MAKTPKITREGLKAGECLCDHCTGKCCRYFSLPLETPKTWDDFDAIRWYLAHGQTRIYVDKGSWFLLVLTKCQYLLPGNRCAIYFNRPKICQDYSTDECEYDSDWIFEKLFEAPEQVWEYAEAILPARKRKPSEGPRLLPIVNPPSTFRPESRRT